MTMNFALLSLTTTNPTNTNMDYDKKFDQYAYGYTLFVVQVCGGDTINMFTNDHQTAQQALEAYEGWVAHFQELYNRYPESVMVYKIQIKRMLNFKLGNSYMLQDLTLDELKSKIS